MNGQHTAGPWTITRGSHDGALYVIAGSDPSRAEVIAHRTTCPNWEANARLIAAAPDLLEALKALLRESVSESGVALRPSPNTIAAAQAVVRKAVDA